MRPPADSFTKTLKLAAALALLLLSRPAESRIQFTARQAGPLKISSRGTPFGVQVEVEGSYAVYDDYVELSVDKLVFYVSEHCPYQGRRVINTVTLGLATNTPSGRWSVESRGAPVVVERVMRPGDEYTLAGLYFRIPKSAAADLSKRWLVVETEDIALDLPEDSPDRKGYAFAHSCRDIFAHPCEQRER